jgi:ribonucleoside-diphosphate reductase alpha chain
MKIETLFSNKKVEYRKVRSEIRGADGTIVFEMDNVEVPAHWSQTAVNILAQKYFRKAGVPEEVSYVCEDKVPSWLWRAKHDGKITGGETSARQVFHRLAGAWTYHGWKGGYFDDEDSALNFYHEMVYMLAMQMGAPNSPQWFNTGLWWAYGIEGKPSGHFYFDGEGIYESPDSYSHPQAGACFIQSIDDTLVGENGILDLVTREARVFKAGSGSGVNYSNLRGANETLSGGGKSSGLMSFLRLFDTNAGSIKSGGTTRRAARMAIVDVDHPDVETFIDWKVQEEQKAALMAIGSAMLQKAIDDGSANQVSPQIVERFKSGVAFPKVDVGWQGEAYSTISGQNANNSISITEKFMEAVKIDADWNLINRTDGSIAKTVKARDLWNKIAKAAWVSADPGIFFHDTINSWHTCPNTAPINATNPCGEYLFWDDSACNLASLNLMKFWNLEEGFDTNSFVHAVQLWTVALDITVSMSQYPSQKIAKNSRNSRTLGLGYANLGGLLMACGIPYDSDEGRAICSFITSLMTGQAYRTSAKLAEQLGAFPAFDENRDAMLSVIKKHLSQSHLLNCNLLSKTFIRENIQPYSLIGYIWNSAHALGENFGYRNAQPTLLAPTGTIGLIMDCATTGIEPDYSLVKYKELAGGGDVVIENPLIAQALTSLGYPYDDDTIDVLGITDRILKNGTARNLVFDRHESVFHCAGEISVDGHLMMMAAAQPFLSGAISKTVNMPADSTIDDVRNTYEKAYHLGLKDIAIYRDGSKLSQPLNSVKPKEDSKKTVPPLEDVNFPPISIRHRLPPRRHGYTQRAVVGDHKIYLKTGEYEDGRLGEIFIDCAKEGAALRSVMNSLAIAVSIGLQHGVPLEEYVDAFTFYGFEPAGMVQDHARIKSADSLLDYVFRDLGIHYLGRDDLAHTPNTKNEVVGEAIATITSPTKTKSTENVSKPKPTGQLCPCPAKAFSMVRSGTCLVCTKCGNTTGCS